MYRSNDASVIIFLVLLLLVVLVECFLAFWEIEANDVFLLLVVLLLPRKEDGKEDVMTVAVVDGALLDVVGRADDPASSPIGGGLEDDMVANKMRKSRSRR
jgi:hypothetical protein